MKNLDKNLKKKQSLGTTAYTVSKLEKVWMQWHRHLFYLNQKEKNYEGLASAILMKNLLATDVDLLHLFLFTDLIANHLNICKHQI